MSSDDTTQQQQHSGTSATPRRFIHTREDLELFLQSPAKRSLQSFASAMGRACSSGS